MFQTANCCKPICKVETLQPLTNCAASVVELPGPLQTPRAKSYTDVRGLKNGELKVAKAKWDEHHDDDDDDDDDDEDDTLSQLPHSLDRVSQVVCIYLRQFFWDIAGFSRLQYPLWLGRLVRVRMGVLLKFV